MEGVISLADGSFKLASVAVQDAGVVVQDDNGNESLRPKMVFSKPSRKR